MPARVLVLVLAVPSLATAQVVDLVSRNAAGVPGNAASGSASFSDDGTIIAFDSLSTNLVAEATTHANVYVRDGSGTITLITRGLGGVPANGNSFGPKLSGDGRVVVFGSLASNLVTGDTNGAGDIFAYDRELGTLERVNVDSLEAQSSYFWGTSSPSHVTRDGRRVVFASEAADLVPGDTNAVSDVFVRDRLSGETTRLSTFPNGSQLPWHSWAGLLTPSERHFVFSTGVALLPGDFNGATDVYARDLVTGVTQRVSVSSQGVEGNNESVGEDVSADGRFVVFRSHANNLVPGDVNNEEDVFVRDRLLGRTQRVSVSSQGVQANWFSIAPRITDDGRFVYFVSYASNLVPGDTGFDPNLFVRDRLLGTTRRVGFLPPNEWTEFGFALLGNGSRLAFTAAPVDPSQLRQIYLRIQPAPGPVPVR